MTVGYSICRLERTKMKRGERLYSADRPANASFWVVVLKTSATDCPAEALPAFIIRTSQRLVDLFGPRSGGGSDPYSRKRCGSARRFSRFGLRTLAVLVACFRALIIHRRGRGRSTGICGGGLGG